ncbi:MAG: hypothetical protein ACPGSB_08600 [Opitutales bacterium]
MKRKITAVALLSFFAWNAVFGGVGGLLLCLNKSSEESGYSDDDSCLDLELKAVELPQVRIEKGESTPALAALQGGTSDVSAPNFTLIEIAHIVQAQAPPVLMDTSVLVAQTMNLRL